MPYKGSAPNALEMSFQDGKEAPIPASKPVNYAPTLHQERPNKKKRKADQVEEQEPPVRRRAGPANKPVVVSRESYTTAYAPPFMDKASIVEETDDLELDGEIGDAKPVRRLADFAIYESRNDRRKILLPPSFLDAPAGGKLYASGYTSPANQTDEDDAQDDQGGVEACYLNLSPILQYTYNYAGADLIFHIETKHAWYQLDILRPSQQYRIYWRPFFRRVRACQHIISWANRQTTRAAFNLYFAQQKDPFGETFESALLDEAPLAEQLAHALAEQDNYDDLKATPFIRSLLAGRGLNVLPKKKARPPPSNLDLFYLDPRNQAQIRVTTRIAALADGWFNEPLKYVGRRADAMINEEKKKRKEEEGSDRKRLADFIANGNTENKPIKHLVRRAQTYVDCIKIGATEYAVGEVVVIRPSTDVLGDFPANMDRVRPGSTVADFFWFGKILWIKPENMSMHIQWLQHGSLTVVEEFAPPKSLYMLDQCQTIYFQSICGKVSVRYSDDEAGEFDCLFKYIPEQAAFVNLDDDTEVARHAPPNNCAPCNREGERKQAEFIDDIPNGIKFRGHEYHFDDFVLFRDIDNMSGPAKIGRIVRLDAPQRVTSNDPYRVTVKLIGRIAELGCLPDDESRDERHVFLSDEETVIYSTELVRVIFVAPRHKEEWLAVSPYHFYAKYTFPSMDVRSWNDKVDIDPDIFDDICRVCFDKDLERYRTIHTMVREYEALPTLELFAGIGAFGGGMAHENRVLNVTHAIEICPSTAATFKRNFPETAVTNQDVNLCLKYWHSYWKADTPEARPEPLRQIYNDEPVPKPPNQDDIQVVVAGFPCQTHSTLNMYKSETDKKSALILPTLSFVDLVQPRYCYFENVPGFLQYKLNASQDGVHKLTGGLEKGGLKLVLRALLDMGYQVRFGVLQAAHYGTPQRRERFFICAAKRGCQLPKLPQPTHDYTGDNRTLRIEDIKSIHGGRTGIQPIDTKTAGVVAHRKVTIRDAIDDLPSFDYQHPKPHQAYHAERNARKRMGIEAVNCIGSKKFGYEKRRYRHAPLTRFQMEARERDPEKATFVFTKPLDEKTIARVIAVPLRAGADYRGFEKKHHQYQMTNPLSSNARAGFRKGMFGRLDLDEQFYTITTNIGPTAKQSRVLHPSEQRICNVREWARGQGLPDWFEFVAIDDGVTTMHRHIGNAVPWQVSRALGRELLNAMLDDYVVVKDDEDET